MSLLNILFLTLVLGIWMVILSTAVIACLRPRRRRRLLGVSGGTLLFLGFASFIGCAAGGHAPASLEWPIGWSGDTVDLPSGHHVVSHVPASRVQVYDPNWHFLRGWHVDARGGAFAVAALPNQQIEVITARGSKRYIYDINGAIVTCQPAPRGSLNSAAGVSLGKFVPTWPWMLQLSHPIIAFVLIPIGVGVLALGGHVRLGHNVPARRGSVARAPPSSVGLSTVCPACATPIPIVDINVAADTALCRACGHSTTYSAIVHAPVASLYSAPPDRCDVQDDAGRWRAVASTRHWRFFPLAVFALIWNSFLLLFVGGIVIGGAPLFLVLFLSGHLAAGLFMLWTAVCSAIGDVEVVVHNDLVSVGTGVGPLRWRWTRPIRDIRGVRQEPRPRSITGPTTVIVLDGPKPLKFGSLLNDERRNFLHAAIAARLFQNRKSGHEV